MRLTMFSDNFYPELGGIQDSIMVSARELGARGHRILLFAPAAAPRDYARANLSVGEVDLGPNVTIRRVPSLPVPSSSQQSRVVVPTGRCRREVALFRPDLIHSHTFLGLGLEALWAARRMGVPLVGTNHWAIGAFDFYAPFWRATVRRRSLRALTSYYQSCDWVSAPSRFTVAEMVANGLARPCTVISNPIDTRRFHPVDPATRHALKARFGLGPQTIVYAGRLAREKCIDVLIHAFATVCADRPDAILVLAGHGSARAPLAALAGRLGVGGRVRFTGTLGHDALAELLAAADLFAIASMSETQSMVLLQAMACGLPVVGARCGGLIEHIPPATGCLAEPGRSEDFLEKLTWLLVNQSARECMGAAARQFAEAFSITKIADAWEDLYRRVMRNAVSHDPARSAACN